MAKPKEAKTGKADTAARERSIVLLADGTGLGENGKIVRTDFDTADRLFAEKKARAATKADFGFAAA
jgi:hypothetical protein